MPRCFFPELLEQSCHMVPSNPKGAGMSTERVPRGGEPKGFGNQHLSHTMDITSFRGKNKPSATFQERGLRVVLCDDREVSRCVSLCPWPSGFPWLSAKSCLPMKRKRTAGCFGTKRKNPDGGSAGFLLPLQPGPWVFPQNQTPHSHLAFSRVFLPHFSFFLSSLLKSS